MTTRRGLRPLLIGGLLVTLGLAFFVSPLASSAPDGLNKVAAEHGFADSEQKHPLGDSPVAGYELRGVADDRLATALSGIAGVLVTFGIGVIVFGVIARRRSGKDA